MKGTFLLLTVFVLISCDDSNTIVPQNNPPSNFYALTVGNNWDYEYYLKDNTTSLFSLTPVSETVEITHTELINSNVYYNFKHTVTGNNGNYSTLPNDGENNFKLRDSLGYLIAEGGRITYANDSYSEYFVDHLDVNWSYFLQLSNVQDNITTIAGDFSCYDNHFYLKDEVNGLFSNSTDHIYREDGLGEILTTKSFASQNSHFAEKRLNTYFIQ